jgi:AraC-like DNA-binding protein
VGRTTGPARTEVNEAEELELEALMRQRRVSEARLNRALGELLGSGAGADEVTAAIDEVEGVLRTIAAMVARISK